MGKSSILSLSHSESIETNKFFRGFENTSCYRDTERKSKMNRETAHIRTMSTRKWSVYFQNPEFIEYTRMDMVMPEYEPLIRKWCGGNRYICRIHITGRSSSIAKSCA